MTDCNLESSDKKLMIRREFLLAGLAALITVVSFIPANAQRPRRRRPPIRRPARRRMRAIRRRAIRRIRRRGDRLEERARSAIRQGKVRPLRDVMAKIRQRSNAEVLDVDLHRRPKGAASSGEWIYALRLLTPNGRVRDVFLDAQTLDVLHIEKQGGGPDGVPLPPPLQRPPQRPLQKKPAPIPLP